MKGSLTKKEFRSPIENRYVSTKPNLAKGNGIPSSCLPSPPAHELILINQFVFYLGRLIVNVLPFPTVLST